MYTLVVKIYELVDSDRVYGYLYAGDSDDQPAAAAAHLSFPVDGIRAPGDHAYMMRMVRALCEELAQNEDVPLF